MRDLSKLTEIEFGFGTGREKESGIEEIFRGTEVEGEGDFRLRQG